MVSTHLDSNYLTLFDILRLYQVIDCIYLYSVEAHLLIKLSKIANTQKLIY